MGRFAIIPRPPRRSETARPARPARPSPRFPAVARARPIIVVVDRLSANRRYCPATIARPLAVADPFGAALLEPSSGFRLLSGLGRDFDVGFALGAELFDQRLAIVAEPGVAGRVVLGDSRLLGGARDDRVELALRAQSERDRVLGVDVLDVPV